MKRHHEAIYQEFLLNFIRKVQQALCEIQFIVMVEVFDIGLDSIATCHHPSAINLITLSIFSLSHGLKILHSRLESKLGLLHISPSELSLLELLVNLVCLLVLEVEEIFIDQH